MNGRVTCAVWLELFWASRFIFKIKKEKLYQDQIVQNTSPLKVYVQLWRIEKIFVVVASFETKEIDVYFVDNS